ASCGEVPRNVARYGRLRSAASLLKYAVAITLFAAPCSQTNTIAGEADAGLAVAGCAEACGPNPSIAIITNTDALLEVDMQGSFGGGTRRRVYSTRDRLRELVFGGAHDQVDGHPQRVFHIGPGPDDAVGAELFGEEVH